ncbi:MAG: FG-GAP-like repeat-containing protein [Candidatus Heimdallarchaeota archaeon]
MKLKIKTLLLLFITTTMLHITIMNPFPTSPGAHSSRDLLSTKIDKNHSLYVTERSIRSQQSLLLKLQPKWVWMDAANAFLTIQLGDVNGDQLLDVVAGASSYVVAIDGRTGSMIWNNTDPVGRVFSLSIGNLDGDAKEDVIAGGFDRNVTAIQGATGTLLWKFGGKSENAPQEVIRTIETADFTGDGIDDIIAGSDDWHIYCIDGVDGTLLWRRPKEEVIINLSYAIALGDLDNDSRIDIVIGDASNVFSYKGADGELMWRNPAPRAGVWSLIAADINKDHRIEVLAACADGKLYVFDGRTGQEIWQFTVGGVIRSIALGDFDGDGVQNDILTGSYNQTVTTINGMDGTELWTTAKVGGWIRIVKTGDFNGDGISDAVIGASDNTIYILDGKMGEILTTISTFNSITDLDVADVERDGFLDLIFADGIALRSFSTGGRTWVTESTIPPIPTDELTIPWITPVLTLATFFFIATTKLLKKRKIKKN